MALAAAMGGSTSRRYSQRQIAGWERFEEQVLAPMSQTERIMAEVEQNLMRAEDNLRRYKVAILTAQRLLREWRDAEMEHAGYPWRR